MADSGPPRSWEALVSRLIDLGQTIATAESCTGGLIASSITDVAGSSACFLGGVVAYSNEAKANVLGVDAAVIESRGAVSEEVAALLAKGALKVFGTDWAVGVTGIAGPSGGTPEKPVGLVFMSVASQQGVEVARHEFSGSRIAIKSATADAALEMLGARIA
jgi:PncC family amidohydrolase